MAEEIILSVWARLRGLTPCNARRLAEAGRIHGARVQFGRWIVPADSPLPEKLRPGRKAEAENT